MGGLRAPSSGWGPVFSPGGWSCDWSLSIFECVGELTDAQDARPDVLDEHRSSRCEVAAAWGFLVGVDNPDRHSELLAQKVDGLGQVGVIGDHHGDVAVLIEGVAEQVRGEVDVRPL